MKEDNKSKENTSEKFFWIIGIGIIVFLILLLGSLIGLKITRDKISGISGFQFASNKSNYDVLEDGTMKNVNDELLRAEIDIDNIRFSNFAITQRNEDIGESGEFYDTDINFNIENMNKEVVESAVFIVTLYGSDDTKLIDFSIQLDNLPAREPIMYRQNVNQSCVDAAHVDIEKLR